MYYTVLYYTIMYYTLYSTVLTLSGSLRPCRVARRAGNGNCPKGKSMSAQPEGGGASRASSTPKGVAKPTAGSRTVQPKVLVCNIKKDSRTVVQIPSTYT